VYKWIEENQRAFICTLGSIVTPVFLAPHMDINNTIPLQKVEMSMKRYIASKLVRIPLVKAATKADGSTCSLREPRASTTWAQERAAFVQIARDGKDRTEGLRGDGMNGR
jgi:hypothetical protein